eukprot:sb/3474843/
MWREREREREREIGREKERQRESILVNPTMYLLPQKSAMSVVVELLTMLLISDVLKGGVFSGEERAEREITLYLDLALIFFLFFFSLLILFFFHLSRMIALPLHNAIFGIGRRERLNKTRFNFDKIKIIGDG